MTTCVEAEPTTSSTHKVEVVPVALEKHPNADKLSIVRVYGYTCVVATEQWAGVERAAYLPPDSLADASRPEFAFLSKDATADGKVRIRARKLRGVLSFGLLVPAPDGLSFGDDAAAALGVTHYDPPVRSANPNTGGLYSGGEAAAGPDVRTVKYDLEAGRRYAQQVLTPGEPVVITEKVHGANLRAVFSDGVMYVGSRTEWKKEYPDYSHVTVESLAPKCGLEKAQEVVERLRNAPRRRNLWWQALDATPTLRTFCGANPGVVVYGEVYGAVQDLTYGCTKGEVKVAAFDLMRDGRWLDFEEAYSLANTYRLPWVPVLNGCYDDGRVRPIPFDFEAVCAAAEGKSLVAGANHVREGVVVRTVRERYDDRVGRVCLKWVGAGYLERSK